MPFRAPSYFSDQLIFYCMVVPAISTVLIRNWHSCLGLTHLPVRVIQGKLFKLQPDRSDRHLDPVKLLISLEHFLHTGLMTEKTKRILVVLLSYSVLHLYETKWMQSWSSLSLVFFRTKVGETPLRPFLQISISDMPKPGDDTGQAEGSAESETDDLLPHPCSTIVNLAVMLMEVFFAAPFNNLAKRFDVSASGETSGPSRYWDVEEVFEACKGDILEDSRFRSVVDKCLDPRTWLDEDGKRLDS